MNDNIKNKNSIPLYKFLVIFCLSLVLMVTVVFLVSRAKDPKNIQLSEDYLLQDARGKDVMFSAYSDRPKLIFFGFTNCTTVCPVAMTTMSLMLGEMGSNAGKLYAMFISTDPDRDKPERIKEYLRNFRGEFVGLTGQKADLEKLYKAYNIYVSRIEPKGHKGHKMPAGDYEMNHSTQLYLVGRKGEVIEVYESESDPAKLAAEVKERLGL